MTSLATTTGAVRRLVRVGGVVQGVGFRPFVYRLATELGLTGHVGNDADGVFIEVEGARAAVEALAARLVVEAPPLARVVEVSATPLPVRGDARFEVVESRRDGPALSFVPPDVGICDECLAELFDPADRRYRHPFVNCTNCGPRFTITVRLPYDRSNTTMAGFEMCGSCRAEYEDPSDRRFHAQPIACPACGPRLLFERGDGSVVTGSDAALAGALEALGSGRIVAIKGIGGYHLACDATNDRAVAELRARKRRPTKPFAVMAASLEAARELAVANPAEARLLTGRERPIVLLRRHVATSLSGRVAPGRPRIGILLAYSPLHHLLFAPVPRSAVPVPRFLVMTSGNLSEEPICHRDGDARRRLSAIADDFLVHDRPIEVPCDDSVMQLVDGDELPVRRSRGYTPMPVRLPFESPSLLAVGGELKTTFCLASGRHAWLGQHVGDMGSPETMAAFERAAGHLAGLYDLEPGRIAADLHPGYATRDWAEARAEDTGARLDLVQHHHAHVAAAMAERGLSASARVVGFAFDGTGYGPDGSIWGGEVLVATYGAAERVAHLRAVPLPGGDAAVRKPYRMALSHLRSAGISWAGDLAPVEAAGRELAALDRQLERGLGCVPTSSMGRCFDAVSSLAGLCHEATYEAEAAVELEIAAERYEQMTTRSDPGHALATDAYCFGLGGDGIDPGPVFASAVADLRAGETADAVAFRFHRAVAATIALLSRTLVTNRRLDAVVLTGGVFQNAVLLRLTRQALANLGVPVLAHRMVPPNDGGLALGQAAVSAGRLVEGAAR